MVFYLQGESELMVLWVVQLTHKAVYVGGGVATDVGNEEGDELRRHVVKHGAMHVHLGQDLP